MISNVAPEYAPSGRCLLSATVLGSSSLSDDDLYRAALADLRRMFAGDADALAALEGYQPLRVYRIAYAQFPQRRAFIRCCPTIAADDRGFSLPVSLPKPVA